MRTIVFDIETIGSWNSGAWKPEDLELTVCCTHDSETDRYDSYFKEDLPRLWKLLECADVLVGFNSDHFDIPVLNKYYPGDLTNMRSIDLMKEIYDVVGRRVKLDSIAEATLGTKKSADGLQAMRWWKAGEFEKVRDYCIKDVEITKRIFDHALKHGTLKYKELGMTREAKLDTSKWLLGKSAALTQTLGF